MDYHALDEKEVLKKLNSSEKGLNLNEVNLRLKKYGRNKLKKTRKFNALKIFISQFKSFLILILIFAAILSIFMKSAIDSLVIGAILLINAFLGFSQEYKAEKAIEELKKLMVPKSKVVRNGKIVEVNSEEIVPGDILILREGDKIMADARIIECGGLKVNESSLTGESVPEEKTSKKIKQEVPFIDRINMVYQGTSVVYGTAKAVVIDTGMNTEIGKISELVQEVKAEENPFKEKLDKFAKQIGIFVLILCALIVILLIFDGVEIFESFLVAVSLAVSAIPEGLPAVISLGLALATRRMLKRNILIRKLPASETLGRITVICTDKTGTLTEEKMKVTSVYSDGKLNHNNKLLFKIGVLCNKSKLEENEKGEEYFIGDPTENALITSAKNNFINKKEITEQEPKIKEFPFSSERKMMSIIRKSDNKIISYVKGAPERIIKNSNYELINNRKIRINDNRKKEILEAYHNMAKKGLRVLGFAYKEINSNNISINDAEKELIFVGFQGMIDPPRKEVKRAIELTKNAGIKVIMITGDSKLTAEAVAKEIGLTGKSIDSEELIKMSDNELFNSIDKISVFSRISPKDKLRIIEILKKKKEIVAMTGDGVNDALALKRADIGIAMGIRGTDVARDSSDMVLLDDNFASIVEGTKEGRRIYDNTKKFIKFLLSANFSEVFLVLVVMLIWRDPLLLPLLPLQILWINLITDSLPALALSSESPEEDIMNRKPNKKGILNGIKRFIILGGILSFLIDFIAFVWYGVNVLNIEKARTMAVTSSIMFEMFFVFNCKNNKSVFKSPINKYLISAVLVSLGLHFIALYTKLGNLFNFTPLNLNELLLIIFISLIGFVLVEVAKKTKYF